MLMDMQCEHFFKACHEKKGANHQELPCWRAMEHRHPILEYLQSMLAHRRGFRWDTRDHSHGDGQCGEAQEFVTPPDDWVILHGKCV